MSEARTKAKHRGKKNSVREMPEEDPDFQIAPMIDVLLVLLVFFMSISSTQVLQSTKEIELPVAPDGNDASKSVKSQAIINLAWLTMADAGSITVDEINYPSPADLTNMLVQRANSNPGFRVLIRADKKVRYDYLRAVMVAVAQAKIANVTFSVVDKDAPGAPKT